MAELFGLKISEGAIANLFKRVQVQLEPTMSEIVSLVQQSEVVGSDETSARVEGKNWWEWVFQNHQVSLHLIVPSRGFEVMAGLFGEQWPRVWISDLFSAQQKNAALLWQACLAHQLRDCQYGVDAGDQYFLRSDETVASLGDRDSESVGEPVRIDAVSVSVPGLSLVRGKFSLRTHPKGWDTSTQEVWQASRALISISRRPDDSSDQ